jgi:hypothetical protein
MVKLGLLKGSIPNFFSQRQSAVNPTEVRFQIGCNRAARVEPKHGLFLFKNCFQIDKLNVCVARSLREIVGDADLARNKRLPKTILVAMYLL